MAIEYIFTKESIIYKAQDISESTSNVQEISEATSNTYDILEQTNTIQDMLDTTTNTQDVSLVSNNVLMNTISFPKFNNLFPESLDSSGYIILSTVALLFSIIFFLFITKLSRAVITNQKNTVMLTDITVALYLQQQSIEYRFLLEEMNTANASLQKANARIQLYNYLNKISREICETKNKYLALQLGISFFSRIHARYIKVSPLPEGVLYFKYIGKILQEFQGSAISEEELLHIIVSGYKKDIKEQKEITRESLVNIEIKPVKKNKILDFFRKK